MGSLDAIFRENPHFAVAVFHAAFFPFGKSWGFPPHWWLWGVSPNSHEKTLFTFWIETEQVEVFGEMRSFADCLPYLWFICWTKSFWFSGSFRELTPAVFTFLAVDSVM